MAKIQCAIIVRTLLQTRKLCCRKDDRAMRPIGYMDALNFRDSLRGCCCDAARKAPRRYSARYNSTTAAAADDAAITQ